MVTEPLRSELSADADGTAGKGHAEAIAQIRAHPIQPEFAEPALKIRRNLLIIGTATIVLVTAGVNVKTEVAFAGLTFEGLTKQKLLAVLHLLNFYMTLHFGWHVAEGLMEWATRMTGSFRGIVQRRTDPRFRATGDRANPRENTMYVWWLNVMSRLESIDREYERIRAMMPPLAAQRKDMLRHAPARDDDAVAAHLADVKRFLVSAGQWKNSIGQLAQDEDFLPALRRFELTYHAFVVTQGLRWLLLEAGLPLIIGACALYVTRHNVIKTILAHFT